MNAPRLLHKNSEYGYTSDPRRALIDAGEAIPADTQLEQTARAHRTARQTQLDEWEQRKAAIQREIDWLYSQRNHRQIRSELRALERQLARLDKRLSV